MAKYLATSLATEKVVSAPRVISNCLPISTISMSFVGLESRSTMLPASLAACVPVFMATPTSAWARAGASLVPSPVMATSLPLACSRLISAILSSGRASANLQAVEVHARHAGLGRKGNEDRIAMAKLATSQSIFILCEYHNGAPLGRLVCKRCKLRRIRQLGLSHIWAGIEHRCFAIAQRDRTGFVQEQHVDVSGCFHSAPRHGYDVSLDHAIHACDSDGRQKAADCGRD